MKTHGTFSKYWLVCLSCNCHKRCYAAVYVSKAFITIYSSRSKHCKQSVWIGASPHNELTNWYQHFLVTTPWSSFGQDLSCAQLSAQQRRRPLSMEYGKKKCHGMRESHRRLKSCCFDVHGKNKLLAFPWIKFNVVFNDQSDCYNTLPLLCYWTVGRYTEKTNVGDQVHSSSIF